MAGKEETRVFVGRIPKDVTADNLTDYFSKYGTVTDCYLPAPRGGGGSHKGFGFITFAEKKSMYKTLGDTPHTIKAPSGEEVELNVTEAEPRDGGGGGDARGPSAGRGPPARGPPGPMPGGYPDYGYSRGYAPPPVPVRAMVDRRGPPPPAADRHGGKRERPRLFLGKIPDGCTEGDLRAHFEKFGAVFDVYIPVNRSTGQKQTFAFITYHNHDDMMAAVAAQHTLKGESINVNVASSRDGSRGQRGGGGGGGVPPHGAPGGHGGYGRDMHAPPDPYGQPYPAMHAEAPAGAYGQMQPGYERPLYDGYTPEARFRPY